MIEPNTTVWSYWSGDCPAFSRLCLETVRRHNPTARLVTPKLLEEIGGHEILALSQQVDYSQASVLIRYWLLWKFGGAWIDSDSIALAKLDMVDELGECELVGAYQHGRGDNWQRGIYPTCFAGRQGSALVKECLDGCIALVKRMIAGESIPYHETSVKMLGTAWHDSMGTESIKRHHHWRYYPVPWEQAEAVFLQCRPNHKSSPQWHPNAQVYHLSKAVPPRFAGKTEEEILQSRTFAAFLIQTALGLPPAVPKRTCEILARLPHGASRGAEIGVCSAENASVLLQQRPAMSLLCVDCWGDGVSPGFLEYQGPRCDQAGWVRIKQLALKRLEFAGERAEIREDLSVEAAKAVPDGSLDFVFIDGDHTYEAVCDDLRAWTPKLKPGGLLCGHDYGIPREIIDNELGVKRAVDEWAAKLCRPIERGKDFTWFIQL